MSTVVISKSPSVVVKPSEMVTATGDISLSANDKMTGPMQATVFLVFERPIQEPVETIERGLSRALVHYYPLAGCFASGANAGEVVIKCTGHGVPFVAASANCAIKDVPDLSDPSLQQELAVFYPAATDGSIRYSQPLVLMQVTVFSCGGFVVGATWLHAVADGVGMGQFLQAVGELARGLPSPSVLPVRSLEDSLMLRVSSLVSPDMCQTVGRLIFQSSPMTILDVTIKSSLISRIKHKYSLTDSGRRPCSVFDAVAAVLWRCRIRAIMSDPEALAELGFNYNARKYVGAKDGYYGNCLKLQTVKATCGAVANGDVIDIMKIIQRGKEHRVDDQSDMKELRQVESYNFVAINSWRNIGFEAPDFGTGRPARVMCHWRERNLPLCTVCIPCKDEYNVLAICVKEEHAAAFLKELIEMHLSYA